MTLLGGLFHKRNAPSRHTSSGGPSTATESVASSTSNRDSTDGDYVLPDKSLPPPSPIYNLPAAASSSKLKLPFRRKAFALPQARPKGTPHSLASPNDVPSPRISSVTSDSGHGLPSPPRKSSLFAVYNESLQSVHTLPNEPSSRIHPDTPSRLSSSDVRTESHSPPAGQAHKRSPALFSWARERTKSKPLPPTSTSSLVPSTSPSVGDSSSFNLKSFRHVRADPPATSPEKPPQSLSTPLLAPPRPRSRDDSVASDSSQRISVAAFREAQARSRANSPVPSFRPPSTADTLRVDGNGRKRASTISVVSGPDHPQSSKDAAVAPTPSLRPESSALDTSSDDSGSEEDEEVDSDGEPVPKPARKRTITRRVGGTRARSNAEHNSVPSPIDQTSHTRQDSPKLSNSVPPLTYQTNQAPFTRQRASVSTSALTPNRAARRASILAAANSSSNSYAPSKHSFRKPKDDTDESTDSSDTDSEDMPLSDLVAPRRPGSSASNQSGGRPRMPAKPLIDIKSLAGGPPLLTPILRHEDSVRNFNMNRKEQDVEKDQPFSIPAVLALSSSTSPPISPSTSKQNSDTPVNRPTSAAHYRRFSSDVPIKGPDDDEDLMNAIRLVGALDKDPDQPSGVSKPAVKSPSDRIVPTPIREREPPTSFTVLSRPPQRQSITETSASLSLTSQTQSNVAPATLSSQPEIGARRRPPTMVKPPAQNDKSDAVSVSSAARSSTSRSSSRIPSVPLIHSIPDSPSVKEDYKPGRPRSASRTSRVNPSEDRSQPPPTMLVSAMSSSMPSKVISRGLSLMPQRPFASNSSVRGESPAGSSTGDSSSGRAPFTPRDGSDIGMRSKDDASDVGSTLKARGHAKKLSVTFEDAQPTHGRERVKTDLTNEQRTRERRRSEAKAAIELGKIVNGRGPLHDDSDSDVGLRGRNPAINVTMDNGVHEMMQPGWAPWQQPMVSGMTPMIPPQFGNDPAYLAAHQRALFIAKQTYQMAVAQHAMQMAGEEWERNSNIGFGSGGSVYGGGSGGSVYGGGSGGSVYGGGSGGSVYGGMAGMAPMAMMGMPNMGMLMPPNQWGRSSVAFPSTSSSAYGGISSSQSEFGGTGGWGTRSVYGDSFGTSSSRSNHVGSGVPNSAASAYGGGSRPRASTGVTPSSTSSGHSTKATGKTPARSRAAPPSSWKNGR